MKEQLLLICVWLCATFLSSKSLAQSKFDYADSILQSGNFLLASVEYERIARGSENFEDKVSAQIKRAEAIYFSGDASRAANMLRRIPLLFIDDSTKSEIRFRQCSFYYQSDDFENALALVELHIRDLSSFQYSNKSHWYELGVLVSNELAYYSRALDFVDSLRVIHANNSDKLNRLIILENLYSKKNIPRFKNPKKVALASTLLPGLGHTLSGYPHEGLWNFTLVFASLGYGVFNFMNQNYATAILAGGGLAQKFYFGGMVRAEYLANKRNHQKVRTFADEVKKDLVVE
jgi:hypothetical protein